MGYAVRVRSEKDSKKISQMTVKEKQIRNEWAEFRRKQKRKEERIFISGKELSNMLSKMFG